jgi:ABC-type polysaccharide/polyol phosphate transport system ATPase subunit
VPVVVRADRLSKRFILRRNQTGSIKEQFLGLFHPRHREQREDFWALRDISLEIQSGESIGIIGSNGSGKSTLLKLIAGIHRPTQGSIRLAAGAKLGTMIELGIGFHPELSGRENVSLSAAVHGLSRAEIEGLYDRIVAYSGLEQFMDAPLKNYSSGMHMRLGFSLAVHLNPDILLLDEVFAVGDADFQQRCTRTMHQFQEQQRTLVYVSHSAYSVRQLCSRAVLLDHGRLRYEGSVDGAFNAYSRLVVAGHEAEITATEVEPSPRAVPAAVTGPSPQTLSDEDLDLSWHRQASGGMWSQLGRLQFDFLRAQGLRPEHFLLDVACGALRGGVHFIPYLAPGHYWGLDKSQELIRAGIDVELKRLHIDPNQAHFVVSETFDLSGVPASFDFVIATGLLTHLSLNAIARCMASVVRRLKPDGRFYVAYSEAPDPTVFAPIVHPNGVITYPDEIPYHYAFDTLARLAESVGGRAERLGDWGHPGSQQMMVVTPAPRAAAAFNPA